MLLLYQSESGFYMIQFLWTLEEWTKAGFYSGSGIQRVLCNHNVFLAALMIVNRLERAFISIFHA